MDKPTIAIAMGDAAGIGPELIAKILSDTTVYEQCNPLLVGDVRVMQEISQAIGAELLFEPIDDPTNARFMPLTVDVLHPDGMKIELVKWGKLDPGMGHAAAQCLKTSFELAAAGQVHGVVSAPLNKEAFHLAGYDYLDEVAYLADLTESSETFIMGVMGTIWTVAVTEHIPFSDILARIKKERILSYIVRLHNALASVGRIQPRIAVAALNVHAGEGGLFGREEIDEIGPAIEAARDKGIDAQGPVPADMVFVLALAGNYDGVVSMYHDQANIARKLQPKGEGATIFMGLPVVCGTTAHGTAFDIAGQGSADPGSLMAALRYTIQLSSHAYS